MQVTTHRVLTVSEGTRATVSVIARVLLTITIITITAATTVAGNSTRTGPTTTDLMIGRITTRDTSLTTDLKTRTSFIGREAVGFRGYRCEGFLI